MGQKNQYCSEQPIQASTGKSANLASKKYLSILPSVVHSNPGHLSAISRPTLKVEDSNHVSRPHWQIKHHHVDCLGENEILSGHHVEQVLFE